MRREYKSKFFSFYTGVHNFDFRINLGDYGPYNSSYNTTLLISFGWGHLFLYLPIITRRYGREYGIYHFQDTLVFCSGRGKYHFRYPWSLECIRTSMKLKNGDWEHETRQNRKNFWDEKWNNDVYSETHIYFYILKSGEVQKREATIKLEEREWRWRWFTWLKLTQRIRRTIDVTFSAIPKKHLLLEKAGYIINITNDIGEGVGSYKGGTCGCSYRLLPNETPLQCLRRMERERKFNR